MQLTRNMQFLWEASVQLTRNKQNSVGIKYAALLATSKAPLGASMQHICNMQTSLKSMYAAYSQHAKFIGYQVCSSLATSKIP
jgi:hypothetical protein